MNGLKDLVKKLRRKKDEEEIIPEDCIKCPICQRIVKKENATISLPEDYWICDDCFFRNAE